MSASEKSSANRRARGLVSGGKGRRASLKDAAAAAFPVRELPLPLEPRLGTTGLPFRPTHGPGLRLTADSGQLERRLKRSSAGCGEVTLPGCISFRSPLSLNTRSEGAPLLKREDEAAGAGGGNTDSSGNRTGISEERAWHAGFMRDNRSPLFELGRCSNASSNWGEWGVGGMGRHRRSGLLTGSKT